VGDLQRLAESLGRSTRRAVAIHDRHGHVLAYSSQSGVIDAVRTKSILERHTQGDAIAWTRSLGIDESKVPVRVPANSEMGMLPRVCAPVRFDGQLLGILWLIDPDESLPDDALGTVAAAADTAGVAIHRDQLVRDLDRRYERELLRSLLLGPAAGATAAQALDVTDPAEELVERNILTAGAWVAAAVVLPLKDGEPASATDGAVRLHLERALEEIRAGTEPGQAAYLVRHDHAVIAFAGERDRIGRTCRAAAEALIASADQTDGWDGWEIKVGIGDPAAGLADLTRSYDQARMAVEVAQRIEGVNAIATWRDLGAYRTLLAFPRASLDRASLHPGLAALMDQPDASIWLDTLEEWLDQAGCAPSTAAALGVNRGTIYYRLRRIEALTGADLQRGDDRLALHLGLKLARLGRIS
jgi:hypothetical protein